MIFMLLYFAFHGPAGGIRTLTFLGLSQATPANWSTAGWWYGMTDLNRRSPARQAGAFATKLIPHGSPGGSRTHTAEAPGLSRFPHANWGTGPKH